MISILREKGGNRGGGEKEGKEGGNRRKELSTGNLSKLTFLTEIKSMYKYMYMCITYTLYTIE